MDTEDFTVQLNEMQKTIAQLKSNLEMQKKMNIQMKSVLAKNLEVWPKETISRIIDLSKTPERNLETIKSLQIQMMTDLIKAKEEIVSEARLEYEQKLEVLKLEFEKQLKERDAEIVHIRESSLSSVEHCFEFAKTIMHYKEDQKRRRKRTFDVISEIF